MKAEEPTVLIIVNNLFKWSENFISRELVELYRQGLNLYVGARHVFARDDLSESERSLLERVIEFPDNPFWPRHLSRHVGYAVRNWATYGSTWLTFFRMRPGVSKIGRTLVCLFRAACMANTVRERGVTLMHAHFLNAPGDTALFLFHLTGIPYGGTGHAKDIYSDDSGLAEKIGSAQYITTCSDVNLNFLRQSFAEHRAKLRRVYHGIVPLKELSERPGENGVFTFIAVGRLVAKKGFDCLIDACHILKTGNFPFNCRLVGEGPLLQELATRVEKLNLQAEVSFIGYVPPNQMAQIYAEAHALVMPSIIIDDGDRDGLPNVCLEAMNHGLPVIGTEISAIPEGVQHGENGLLVPPADADSLSRAMICIMESNQREAMGAAGREIIRSKFNLENNVRELKSIMLQHSGV